MAEDILCSCKQSIEGLTEEVLALRVKLKDLQDQVTSNDSDISAANTEIAALSGIKVSIGAVQDNIDSVKEELDE